MRVLVVYDEATGRILQQVGGAGRPVLEPGQAVVELPAPVDPATTRIRRGRVRAVAPPAPDPGQARRQEYPALREQVGALWKAVEALAAGLAAAQAQGFALPDEPAAMLAEIGAIKRRYPVKPE